MRMRVLPASAARRFHAIMVPEMERYLSMRERNEGQRHRRRFHLAVAGRMSVVCRRTGSYAGLFCRRGYSCSFLLARNARVRRRMVLVYRRAVTGAAPMYTRDWLRPSRRAAGMARGRSRPRREAPRAHTISPHTQPKIRSATGVRHAREELRMAGGESKAHVLYWRVCLSRRTNRHWSFMPALLAYGRYDPQCRRDATLAREGCGV